MRIPRLTATLLAALALAGCAANPVTGRSELHMVSEAQEIQVGQQYYPPSRQSQGGDYVTDPRVTEYVRQVGNRLAAVAERRLPYEFVVLNSGELNAWALPGGKIAVNRGLLVELKNEAELAAVLSHEIVHAAARPHQRRPVSSAPNDSAVERSGRKSGFPSTAEPAAEFTKSR